MKNNTHIHWGIIGCGDVCEIKSGPAFNKVDHSSLVAVMRRNEDKARDYAKRHAVPKYYTNARLLVDDPEVNAIYVATPPSTHEEYAVMAIEASKPVYIEKPISMDAVVTRKILEASEQKGVKVTGAYYRRRLPLFLKVKQLIQQKVIGQVSHISIELLLPADNDTIAKTETNWRLNPSISGGGLFHDLAPHMLDILYWLFDEPVWYKGYSQNQYKAYDAPDFVSMNAMFENKIPFSGTWSFHAYQKVKKDSCRIMGDKGLIEFSFFEQNPLDVISESLNESFVFQNPVNIQLPMIRDTVNFFLGDGTNPCSISEALVSMEMMDTIR